MGWDSAKRFKPRPVGKTGAYTPPMAPVHTPEPEPEVLSSEDLDTVDRYYAALKQLHTEDMRFTRNFRTFQKWDKAMRLWWIIQIEAQAAKGLSTIGVHVVTRVIMNRMD